MLQPQTCADNFTIFYMVPACISEDHCFLKYTKMIKNFDTNHQVRSEYHDMHLARLGILPAHAQSPKI